MDDKKEKHIEIINKDNLVYLIGRIENGPKFAETFNFQREEEWIKHKLMMRNKR
ncbi:hypothetical protein [Vallitalea maricola]|uniref:Uncharacterized protein n=1 Tax=Vallitalea maricola TaxID=3074433 RepID=A0ACB5UQA2_9FIRM|nr:hypothetical protein AN2V17_38940 [Vallitalea sp. AN17-2]